LDLNYSIAPYFLLAADWIFPVEGRPLYKGAVLVDGDKIEAILDSGQTSALKESRGDLDVIDLGQAALLPGLINLHTHLDYTGLAHLAGFDQLAAPDKNLPERTMFDWLDSLVAESRAPGYATPQNLATQAELGARAAALAGTSFVVDSSFSGAAAGALLATGLKGLVGLELFGLDESRADFLFKLWLDRLMSVKQGIETNEKLHTTGGALDKTVFLTIAPHAPYTVAPALWQKAMDWAKQNDLPLTCHLAESDCEYRWLSKQEGDERLHQYLLRVMPKNPALPDDETMSAFLRNLAWRGKGASPVAHLAANHLLDQHTIAAHCLKIDNEDAKILAAKKVHAALCPRSNAILGNGQPELDLFLDNHINFGLGTDSLASCPNLDMRAEAKSLARANPGIKLDPAALLATITLEAAKALRMENKIGSLKAGKSADFAAFSLEHPVVDAQEALRQALDSATPCRLLMIDGRPVVTGGRLI
jgi:cytosine/adenosine deaminase-related metal-dependent hydrolase